MPLVRIDLRRGKSEAYRQDIGRVVYEAMQSVSVPKDDRFQVIAEHAAADFIFDPNYLGIPRTDDLVIIQITWNKGRTLEQKKALYKAIADGLPASSASAGKTSSSTSSRSRRRTGRSATGSRSMRLDARDCDAA